jgi:RNA polymerase sigma factor (TIGR02999 family)
MWRIQHDAHDVTALLQAWSDGDEQALHQLMPLVEGELRRIARRQMHGERPNHTLQATALVNEAYLNLVGVRSTHFQNRAHFLAMAARIMRRVLVDHARARDAQKRKGDIVCVAGVEDLAISDERSPHLIALDDALTALEMFDPRMAQIVEWRVFGGLSVEETASRLGVSTDTVSRAWKAATAWLKREMTRGPDT